MTFGNKLLLVIVVSHIQLGTLFASQALCNAFGKQLSLHIENTATECIEIEEEEVAKEASEQELKNKVCEEQLLKVMAASEGILQCNAHTQAPCGLDKAFKPQDLCGMLFFNNDRVGTSLNARTIIYDERHKVELHNGKAVCPLVYCESVKLQKDKEGRNYFISGKGLLPVQIINQKITHIKLICATACRCLIQIYLGYNPQLLGTYDEHGKLYGATILLVQSNLLPHCSQTIVQRFPSRFDACVLKVKNSNG